MATYSDSEKERIMRYPIESVLAHFGKRTDHRGEMYFSPFRDETQPSFHIRRRDNVWMDFGSGQGGNVLTLVNLLSGISLSDCWDYVAGLDPNICVPDARISSAGYQPTEHRIVIERVRENFTSRNLTAYALSRGIPPHILERYCRQVTYSVTGLNGTSWTVIGFPAGDGWVLRHSHDGQYSKRCTGSSGSFLGPAGNPVSGPGCDRVEVFEGFFDFLSWLVLKDRTKPFSDVCVLNSVNNLSRSMDFISSHRDVSCWMDTDNAGLAALDSIRERCPSARDHISEMEGCKDVNELLKATLSKNVIPNNNITNNSITIKH